MTVLSMKCECDKCKTAFSTLPPDFAAPNTITVTITTYSSTLYIGRRMVLCDKCLQEVREFISGVGTPVGSD
jgi:hypothetical protein